MILLLLEQQDKLERMARIVGKDALPDEQQLTLICAELIQEGFLFQSSFSPVDRYCSPRRQSEMLRLLMHFVDRAGDALEAGASPDAIAGIPVLRRLRRLGEELPEDALDTVAELWAAVDSELAELSRAERVNEG